MNHLSKLHDKRNSTFKRVFIGKLKHSNICIAYTLARQLISEGKVFEDIAIYSGYHSVFTPPFSASYYPPTVSR